MKAQKYQNPSTGYIVESSILSEIRMMKACGWRKVKDVKIHYAKDLNDGNNFLK